MSQTKRPRMGTVNIPMPYDGSYRELSEVVHRDHFTIGTPRDIKNYVHDELIAPYMRYRKLSETNARLIDILNFAILHAPKLEAYMKALDSKKSNEHG